MTTASEWSPQSDVQLVRATMELFKGTSLTSNTIANSGSLSFTTQTYLYFDEGKWIEIIDNNNSSNWMAGQVTSYNELTGALVFAPKVKSGSGTIADWLIYSSGVWVNDPWNGGTVTNPVTINSTLAVTGTTTLAKVNSSAQISSTAGDVNLCTVTALADASATLSFAQIFNGVLTIAPTTARVLTLPSAATIIAALTGYEVGSQFTFTVLNTATSTVTIAPGTGVVMNGRTLFTEGSTTYLVRVDSATVVSVYNISQATTESNGVPGQISDGVKRMLASLNGAMSWDTNILPTQISDGVTRVLNSLNGVASWGVSGVAGVETRTASATLTSSSAGLQRITAANYGLIMKLPNATTLSVGGPKFILDNTASAYPVKVVNSEDTLLGFIPAGEVSYVSVSDISTAAGVWNCSNLQVIGCSAQLATVLFSSITSVVDLGSGRELIIGGEGSALYCVMYTRTTNTFSSVVAVRTAAASVSSYNAALLQSANKVLVVSCSSTTALEAVVIDTSGATPVVKTAATATLSADIGAHSFNTNVATPLTLTDSGSVLFSYNVATPAAQIRAISVSGFTTTIGAAATLDGTQGANSPAGGLVMAATGGVIAVSVATTNLYTKYYGVSGSSITTGSGTTTAGGTMTLNKATALGSRWAVLYNDGGTTCKGGIVSLSGTTTSISVATLFSAGTFTDAAVIGSTKILAHNTDSASNANILTDSSGTASAGTAITINSDATGTRVIVNVSGNTAYTQSGQSNQFISKIDCSGASPVLSLDLIYSGIGSASVPIFSSTSANFVVSGNCIRGTNYASTISFGTSTAGVRSELRGDVHHRGVPYLLHNSAVIFTRGRNNSERWARDNGPCYTIAKIECVQ